MTYPVCFGLSGISQTYCVFGIFMLKTVSLLAAIFWKVVLCKQLLTKFNEDLETFLINVPVGSIHSFDISFNIREEAKRRPSPRAFLNHITLN